MAQHRVASGRRFPVHDAYSAAVLVRPSRSVPVLPDVDLLASDASEAVAADRGDDESGAPVVPQTVARQEEQGPSECEVSDPHEEKARKEAVQAAAPEVDSKQRQEGSHSIAGWSRFFSALLSRLEGGHDLSSPSGVESLETIRPVSSFIRRALGSDSLGSFISRSAIPQFEQVFLPSALAEYVARYFPADQLQALLKYMKAHIDTLIFKILLGSQSYFIHVAPSVREARLIALRSALHKRFPLLATEGYACLARPPVFYLSEGSPVFASLERFIWDLSLTKDCFRIIPLRVHNAMPMRSLDPSPHGAGTSPHALSDSTGNAGSRGSADQHHLPFREEQERRESPYADSYAFPSYTMDPEILEAEIEADIAQGRLPCAVLATVGASANRPYQYDDLSALRGVCDRYGLWLHAEGSSVLLAASPPDLVPSFVLSVFEHPNSVCAEPLEWFQLRGDLALTFVRSSKASNHMQRHFASPPAPVSRSEFDLVFSLWCQLLIQAQPASSLDGRETSQASPSDSEVVNGSLAIDPSISFLSYRLGNHLQLCRYLRAKLLSQVPFPVVLGPGLDHPHVVLFELHPPNSMPLPLNELNMDLLFYNKYLSSRLHSRLTLRESRGAPATSADPILPMCQIFYDGRVGWLYHPLAERPGLGSHAMLSEFGGADGELGGGQGQDLLSEPFEPTGRLAVDSLVEAICKEVTLLERAAKARREFEHVIHDLPELEYVPREYVNEWVGVGCFRFVPAFPVPRNHCDALNVLLAHRLTARDSRLYRGSIAKNKAVCIVLQTGAVFESEVGDSPQRAVRAIVDEILDVSSKMELPPEVIDSLSEVVLQGIRQAEQRLRENAERRYTPDRIVRELPLVGRVWNWLSPLPHDGASSGSSPSALSSSISSSSSSGLLALSFDIRSQQLVEPQLTPLVPNRNGGAAPVPSPSPNASSGSGAARSGADV